MVTKEQVATISIYYLNICVYKCEFLILPNTVSWVILEKYFFTVFQWGGFSLTPAFSEGFVSIFLCLKLKKTNPNYFSILGPDCFFVFLTDISVTVTQGQTLKKAFFWMKAKKRQKISKNFEYGDDLSRSQIKK